MRALIAGGGVAGAAVACLLGPDALVIERETAAHDKICGEFISHEAQSYIERLGLNVAALDPAPINRVRLVHGDRVATAQLPFQGIGLSRRALDAALLDHAGRRGASILRGYPVRGISAAGLEVAGQGTIPAPAIFLATGKHDLRGARRRLTQAPEELVGLKMYFRLHPQQTAELANHVELVLFKGGYAGLQLVEGKVANLCLLIRRDRFAAAGEDWPGVQALLEQECAHLRCRLHGATRLLDRPLAIFRVPYGYVHRPAAGDPPGLFRLGDQMGVIPSFCGDGVSIALHTAFGAVAAQRTGTALSYHRTMQRDVAAQIGRATLLLRAGRAGPSLGVWAAQLWPGALRWIAAMTRVPPWAMREL